VSGLRAALGAAPLPAALVDLDAFERNVDRFVAIARAGGKRLRVASKSVRVPELLGRVRDRAGDVFGGLMTYHAAETAFLAGAGWRDLLLAYPTATAADAAHLAAANAAGATAAVVVDDVEQLAPLAAAAGAAATTIPVVVEIDVSYRRLGLHLGVRRSPLHDAAAVVALAERAAATPGLRFHGLMGYEAQIAGLPDRSPFTPWQNAAKRQLKRLSAPAVAALRAECVAQLRARGLAPRIVNGAGTGNAGAAAAEATLDEITVGSGFLCGHLFDYYAALALDPALFFALQVVRRPARGLVTCHGGGYVASGAAGPDRLPRVAFPEGAELLPMEGAGEVQTPVKLPAGVDMRLGDPIFFRPAKSGELAEHFAEYLLARGGALEGRAATYRGLGHCFLG
jgi:D-serine deaminase-like pyridoxal phosphate-dependent protein